MSKRGQNEGTIFQRSDGRWTAAINLGWRNGRRKRKYLYGTTRREVQEKLTRALRDQQLGIPVVTERQTIGQFLHSWLDQVAKPNVRPSTYGSYSWIIDRHLAPGLGRFPLPKLSPQQVQSFLNEKLESGLAPRTVQHIHATLRVVLAIIRKRIFLNICRGDLLAGRAA